MKETKGSKGKAVGKTEVELSAIEKIRKLMEFSIENGATEAEVESAMKLAQKLMIKHNLEHQDLAVTSKDVNTTVVESTWLGRTIMVETRSFENRLLNLLGNVYSCKVVVTRDKARNTDSYSIVGLPDDRKILISIYESILPQIRTLARKRFKESDRTLSEFKFTTSYQSGFLEGMREKLAVDRAASLKVAEKKQFDLILVKKDELITEWISKHMAIKTSKIKGTEIDPQSYELGKEDGSEKGLNKQLGK